MRGASRLASALYTLVGLAFTALGLRYLLAPELMPYHLEVLQTPWGSLDAPYQTLALGLLRGFGAGALCAGVATLWLAARSFRSPGPSVFLPLALLALGYSALLLHVTRAALLPGARPIEVSAALCGLAAVAALASWLGRGGPPARSEAQAGADSL